jgi:hypothetical protein
MRVLVIISTGDNICNYIQNIISLRDHFKTYIGYTVEYALISSIDYNCVESVLDLKYKEIDTSMQLTKLCNFITKYKSSLNYDFFIKIRPEIQILDRIPFEHLLQSSINARAREYIGPKRLRYGNSVYGEGCYKTINASTYSEKESHVVLDDQIYIFHKTIVESGGFNTLIPTQEWYVVNNIAYNYEHEWFHSNVWKSRNIHLNVIDINIELKKYTGAMMRSGALNL